METQLEKQRHNPIGAVMMVGAGISGIQAALDLANSGFKVYLVEKGPAIGGNMAKLDKTFPTNDCSMCILGPKFLECERNVNIKIITLATVKDIEGEAGHFTVRVLKKPRYIDEELCNNCGICIEYCPVRMPDVYNQELSTTKCMHIHFPQAIPAVPLVDPNHCLFLNMQECKICVPTCKRQAINLYQEEEILELEVGAVILALGYEPFDPVLKPEYGYGRFKNVISSLEFERILSASGPFQGHIQRPSDGKEPKKVAWIQCVGSRDVSIGRGYCSSVCCMYATKQAIIAKEHRDTLEPTIFFIDLRAHGKEFERYYERAKEKYHVRYIRSMVSSVKEFQKNKNLLVTYSSENRDFREEEFDLVVLSVGIDMSPTIRRFAQELSIDLNSYDFCKTDSFSPLHTSRPGIYVCGTFSGPKDIPDSVMQASGATSIAEGLLSPARGTLIETIEKPEERDVSGEEPRIAVIVCNCGTNIASVVDVKEVARYAQTLPNVVYTTGSLFACAKDSQEILKEIIKERDLNRVVVAACTPRTHEYLFQETIREAGLNRFLFEMANIREHCSWVHSSDVTRATEKAKDLVRMAVAKARLLEPSEQKFLEINHEGLIIGGGIAGMVSALSLADMEFRVHLIEKTDQLGGMAKKINQTLGGQNIQRYVEGLIEKVSKHPSIKLYLNSEIAGASGFLGNFKTKINGNSGQRSIDHGVVILATGAQLWRPNEYLYGENPNVLTSLDLEEALVKGDNKISQANTVVFIQCVGSRIPERLYCSRLCCSQSIKNALRLKELNPNITVYILYRDIRAYGFVEDYYREARAKGVIFIRYDLESKPDLKIDGRLLVSVPDPVLGRPIEISADLLILAPAIVASPDNKKLSELYKVATNEDGFFLEAHMKLRPVDFATDGIFLAGLAHYPKPIEETIAQAQAAAARAATILSKPAIELEAATSEVIDDVCDGCAYCIETCPFQAISLIEYMKDGQVKKIVETNESLCKGCGNCQATCPKRGIYIRHFRLDQLEKIIEAALE